MSTQPFPTLRRLGPALAPVLLVGALLTACGESEPTAGSSTPSSDRPSGTPAGPSEGSAPEGETGQRIQVTLEQGAYSPLGERVEVALDEPVVIEVTADEAGTLHVHSTPEQEIEFGTGTSEHEVSFGRPGVVEVESHDPALVILQLEVR